MGRCERPIAPILRLFSASSSVSIHRLILYIFFENTHFYPPFLFTHSSSSFTLSMENFVFFSIERTRIHTGISPTGECSRWSRRSRRSDLVQYAGISMKYRRSVGSHGSDEATFRVPFSLRAICFSAFFPAKSWNCEIEKLLIDPAGSRFFPKAHPGEIDISSRSVSNRSRPSTTTIISSMTFFS